MPVGRNQSFVPKSDHICAEETVRSMGSGILNAFVPGSYLLRGWAEGYRVHLNFVIRYFVINEEHVLLAWKRINANAELNLEESPLMRQVIWRQTCIRLPGETLRTPELW